jgi:cysteine protease ATG4
MIEGTHEENGSTTRKTKTKACSFGLNNLLLNTKSKLYNICKPISKAMPHFSTSPVVFLGCTYRQSSPRSAGGLNRLPPRRRQAVNGSSGGGSSSGGGWQPSLYSNLLKLSVPWVANDSTEPSSEAEESELPTHLQAFLQDFRSRVWLTYRSNFPPIEGTTIVTDMGWGCMLRSGQMILAQALTKHHLGREWPNKPENIGVLRELLRWFGDSPSPNSPYSIHSIARTGLLAFGKKIGDWFEPTTISEALRLLVQQHSPGGLRMYVAKDGIIYKRDVYHLCTVQSADGPAQESCKEEPGNEQSDDEIGHFYHIGCSPSEPAPSRIESESETQQGDFDTHEQSWHPVMILVPVRLGIQCLNPVYIPSLKTFLSFPQSLGIIGGKPHSAFYLVGYQDNQVLYMDPHFVQPTVSVEDHAFPIESYHMEIPQAMAFADIDPSLALGFLCSTQTEFENFCANATAVALEQQCVFSIADQRCVYKSSSTAKDLSLFVDGDPESFVLV